MWALLFYWGRCGMRRIRYIKGLRGWADQEGRAYRGFINAVLGIVSPSLTFMLWTHQSEGKRHD